jgi:hypothetical protein
VRPRFVIDDCFCHVTVRPGDTQSPVCFAEASTKVHIGDGYQDREHLTLFTELLHRRSAMAKYLTVLQDLNALRDL